MDMKLSEKIGMLRKKAGFSQEELAEKLDISRQSVSKWELGDSVPELDKIVRMSELFGVTTDFLLKEEQETAEPERPFDSADGGEQAEPGFSSAGDGFETADRNRGFEEAAEKEKSERLVSGEEACAYMKTVKKASGWIATAVSLFILSPVLLIFLGGYAEYTGGITEDFAGSIGVAVLLLLVAVGAGICIMHGMQLSKWDFLEKELFQLEPGVKELVEAERKKREGVHRRNIAIGVVLCILGVIPIVLSQAFAAGDFVEVVMLCLFFFMIAVGVHVLVRNGMEMDSHHKLLQDGDYSKEKKQTNKQLGAFPSIYWCTVTAIYLAWSFTTRDWDSTWIVWPIAGVLFAAVWGILQSVVKKKQ